MESTPERLNKVGIRYWDIYIKQIDVTPVNLLILEDLCYWEERKEFAEDEIKKLGRDYIAYKDEKGKIKHTQPVAMMTNLKTSQEKINFLRGQLFGEAKAEKGGEVAKMEITESKLKKLK